MDALIKEISLKKDKLKQLPAEGGFDKGIKSLYFGGGTPSQLPPDELKRITDSLRCHFGWDNDIEFTLEANPDDISAEVLNAWRDMGVNRLSLGIQSFKEKDLKYLGRQHNAALAERAINLARDTGYNNINIDLIYGIPEQTTKDWEENLEMFISLNLQHLSAYCLTVEPRTPLHVLINKEKKNKPSEQQAVRHFEILLKVAHANNMIHYEISNFCFENYYSKHNLGYWQRKPYLGFGASAHSFYAQMRSWNVANTSVYIKNIAEGNTFSEEEQLDEKTRYNEYVLTALRTLWGCDMDYVKNIFDSRFYNYLVKQSGKYLEQGLLSNTNHFLVLTDKGKLFADGISADLFMVD